MPSASSAPATRRASAQTSASVLRSMPVDGAGDDLLGRRSTARPRAKIQFVVSGVSCISPNMVEIVADAGVRRATAVRADARQLERRRRGSRSRSVLTVHLEGVRDDPRGVRSSRRRWRRKSRTDAVVAGLDVGGAGQVGRVEAVVAADRAVAAGRRHGGDVAAVGVGARRRGAGRGRACSPARAPAPSAGSVADDRADRRAGGDDVGDVELAACGRRRGRCSPRPCRPGCARRA